MSSSDEASFKDEDSSGYNEDHNNGEESDEEREASFVDEDEEEKPKTPKKIKLKVKKPQATRYDDNDDDLSFAEDDHENEMYGNSIPKKKKARSNGKNGAIPKKKSKKTIAKEEEEEDEDEDVMDDDYSDSAEEKKVAPKKLKKPKTTKQSPKAAKTKNGVKKEPSSTTPKKRPRTSASPVSSSKKAKPVMNEKRLKMDKTERLNHAMRAFCWWDAPEPPTGYQWLSMEHAGVSFPDPYVPHGVKMLYKGDAVDLSPVEEEAATFFAAMDPDGMHLGNPKTAKIFIDNFFKDFKAILGKGHIIKEFKHCDFSPIRTHLEEQKLVKKAITDEEKLANKEVKNVVLYKFGYALVDGHLERVGNFNMEPPGAFRGRGEHPKMGKLKQRVRPEQVSLNFSEKSCIPKCIVPGHAWGDLRHDPQVQWLANWKENINNQDKYMQLAAQSSFKGKSDRGKYNKAALLCDNIDKIRANYKKNLKAKSSRDRQMATAMWVIDRLALRVGGEKDTEEEADTVGCCSLRVEHLHFDPNEEGGENMEIELEFLGKDSMLYKQTIDFNAPMYNDNNGMGTQVYKNFYSFCRKKKPDQQVFDDLTPTNLNAHLKDIMEGLTAKVFRTYNASKTLQDELSEQEKLVSWKNLTAAEKVVEYNNANRQVAILCNHQRSVSKAQETQLGNLGTKLETLKNQKLTLKKILKKLEKNEPSKIPLKKPESEVIENAAKAVQEANRLKQEAKTKEDKIAATHAMEEAKKLKREAADAKFTQAHLWEKIPSKDQVKKRIEGWTNKIKTLEMNIKHKDDNKEVALGTSKLNYMDPRISVAWCKRNEVPIEKVFSKTLREKFNWAMAVPPGWKFDASIAR